MTRMDRLRPFEIRHALERYRTPLGNDLIGARCAVSLADIVQAFLRAQRDGDRDEETLQQIRLCCAVGFPLHEEDRLPVALSNLGAEHEPPPAWEGRVMREATERAPWQYRIAYRAFLLCSSLWSRITRNASRR